MDIEQFKRDLDEMDMNELTHEYIREWLEGHGYPTSIKNCRILQEIVNEELKNL